MQQRKPELARTKSTPGMQPADWTVAYAENFHGGFIQWHMVLICIWCTLFVSSQF